MSIERLLYEHQAAAPQVPARRADEIGRLKEEEVTAMRWLRNLPVSRKFTFAFGIVCGLCMLLGGYSLLTFHRIAQMSGDVSQNNFPSVLALAQIRNAANNARREDLDLLLCTTPTCMSTHTGKRQTTWADYQTGVKLYEPLISYPGERELYQRFSTAFAQYQEASDRANSLLMSGKAGDALDLLTSNLHRGLISHGLCSIE
jgi:methyl-accepting chemotaxis protein